ncbi:ATP-dependent zinc protease [Agaribacterium haliotis]|uniref:ATP-dependent zinc protease family protein n=1 Tax=Agaribacterium haliotis TaxID=2013869 RepID=UPI00130407FC|nr:RimK/LysX family protein [Agaribacterium haliotis]
MTRALAFFLIFLCSCSNADSKTANKNNTANTATKVVAGWVERVCIEGLQEPIKAKLDSGAKTSSIYAENIKPYKKDGKNRVEFTLVLNDSNKKVHRIKLDKPRSRKVKIKNHDGVHDRRVTVELDISFNNKVERAEFTLVDRSEYIYPILLGRRYLGSRVLIDPGQTFLKPSTCSP